MKITLALTSKTMTRTTVKNWDAEPSETPGLVICKTPASSEVNGEGVQADDGTWVVPAKQDYPPNRYYYNITHLSSGIAIIDLIPNKSLAHIISRRLNELDWTVNEETIKANPDYKKLVRKVWEG